MRRSLAPFRVLLVAAAAAYAALGLGPLAATFGAALWERSDELAALAASAAAWSGLARSAALGALAAAGSLVLAVPLALLTGRARLHGRNVLAAAAIVALALPPYNVALALDPWLAGGGLAAAALVLSLALYPIPFVFLRAGLASIDASLEEVALLGRGRAATLRGVTWPLARPWLVAAAGIVFLLGLGEYGVPALLGLPVYSGQIVLRFAATYDAAGAAVAALPLAAAVFLFLAVESVLVRRIGAGPARLRPAPLVDLGRWRWPATILGVAIVLVSPGLAFVLTLARIDGDGLRAALAMAAAPVANSLLVAAAGGLAALGVGLALALLGRRGDRWFRALPLFFFVTPGAVLGVGFIGLWNRPGLPPLYGSLALVVLALVVRYALLPERAADAALASIPAAEEEVARLGGRGEAAVVLRILCPQIAASLLAGAVAFVLFALRDLDTVVTLYPPGGETLAVRLFTVLANAPPGLQAALSMAQMLVVLPLVAVLFLVARKSRWIT